MKLHLKLFLILLIISPTFSLLSQEDEDVGEMIEQLESTKDYFKKAQLLYRIGSAYHYTQKDSSIYYYKQALEAAKVIDDNDLKALCNLHLGYQYQFLDPVKTVEHAVTTIELSDKIEDSTILCQAHNLMGLINRNKQDLKKSMESYQSALNVAKIIKDSLEIARAYNGIGIVHMMSSRYNQGLDYWKKALEIKLQLDHMESAAATMINIGLYYKDINRFDEAENYARDALEIDLNTKDYESAAFDYKIIGDIYYKQGENDKAIELYKTSIAYADTSQSIINKEEQTRLLAELYSKKNEYDKAYQYLKEYIKILELSYDENSQKIIQDISTKYEIEKTEQQLELLNEQNKTKDAELKAQKAENELQSSRNIYLTIGLSLTLVLLVFIFYFFRKSQRSNKIIEQQKQVVEEKNTEILDSIQYAKRLQDAILPPQQLIQKFFDDSFILYEPKDIVSGDFYWMETTKEHLFLAAADCTGHGVPGAMVSVVCANALNKVVIEMNIQEPGEILDATRELVIQTFEKSGADVKDGMDISLIRMSKTSLLEGNTNPINARWAGANNPLWVIRKDATKIEEIKADKQPIGLYGDQQSFTNHSISLNKGDQFYLFSDGYADQFGGPKGKKLKTGNFKKLLIEFREKSMQDQKLALLQSFQNWKGDHEQLDDLCVIGVTV